ncbi:MAG: GspH/FimT family pseudopilin [Lysobacterales bacterium]
MKQPSFLSSHGFTLIELMVAVAVVAILSLIALPSFSGAFGRTDQHAILQALSASFLNARTASMADNENAILCPSSDGIRCSGEFAWQIGWIVGIDHDGNGDLGPGDSILERREAFAEPIHMLTSSGRRRLKFQPFGSNAGSNATFTLCSRRGKAARAYALSNFGRFHEVPPKPEAAAAACAGF